MDKAQPLDSLVAKCLAENQLPADPKLVEQVTKIFLKAGKRVFTAALQTQLQGLGIQTDPQPVSHDMVVQAALAAR